MGGFSGDEKGIMAAYLVIFGAAVRPDGSASGSLARRVNIALTIAERLPNCRFIATGVRVPSDRPHLGWRQWLLYVLKECLVLPYDAVLMLLRGKT